jgi:lambda family phage portal protein
VREVKQKIFQRTWLHAVEDFADSAWGLVSPQQAAERKTWRRRWRAAEQRFGSLSDPRMAGTYEGAANDTTRGSSWLGSKLSPDSALEADLPTLRARALELYRNDCIGGAVDSRANMVVSYGFTPQARIAERPGIATKTQADKWNGELEDVYARIACDIDKNGKRSLMQDAKLVEKHHGAYGESLTILSDREDPSRPIPLTIEIVDPERLETPPGRISDKHVRLGVEHNDAGKIVAYWIRKTHPGDTLDISLQFDRVPAERVLHVFEPLFAQQSRGLPWLLRALNRAKDAKDLDEAAVIAAQVEACFAAFVTSPMGGSRAADAALVDSSLTDRVEDIRPGTVRYLDSGESVSFGQPTRAGSFAPFQEWNYRRAAAGLNYPYEMLVKDWTGLTFAGGRLALTEGRLFVQAAQQLLIECWLCKIWERLVFESVLLGACSIPPRLYEEYAWWFNRCNWTPPAWPFALTPGEEIDAKIKAVNNNFMAKAKVVGEFGGDFEDVAAQRRDEVALEREYEILPPEQQQIAVQEESLQQKQQAAETAKAPRQIVKEVKLGRNELTLLESIQQTEREVFDYS